MLMNVASMGSSATLSETYPKYLTKSHMDMIRAFSNQLSNNYDGFKLVKHIYDNEIFLLKCSVQNFGRVMKFSKHIHVNVNKRKHFPKRIAHVTCNKYLTKSHMDTIRTFSNNYDGFKLVNYIYNNEIFLLKCALQSCLLNVS